VPRRLEGREEFRAYLARSAALSGVRLDDLRVDAVHETADPEVIVMETATCGTVVATGRRFELPAIAVLRVRDGEIVSWRDYINTMARSQVMAGTAP
jgi:ketosteroid isomerase-like protein